MMMLSEAIRLGGMSNLQGYGSMMIDHGNGDVRTCAMGGAALASGFEVPSRTYMDQGTYVFREGYHEQIDVLCWELRQQYPELNDIVGQCKDCNLGLQSEETTLLSRIVHLNDNHHWSRTKIADWVQDNIEKLKSPEALQEAVPALVVCSSSQT